MLEVLLPISNINIFIIFQKMQSDSVKANKYFNDN